MLVNAHNREYHRSYTLVISHPRRPNRVQQAIFVHVAQLHRVGAIEVPSGRAGSLPVRIERFVARHLVEVRKRVLRYVGTIVPVEERFILVSLHASGEEDAAQQEE